jgi:hypothetical protein
MKTGHSVPLVLLIAGVGLHAAPPTKAPNVAPAAGEKTHSLFMGIDVSVERDKTFYHVRDVSGSSWVINVHGRPEFVPTDRSSLNLKVDQSLKLTDASALLADLKAERAYMPGSDPRTQSLRKQVQSSAFFTEVAQTAERNLREAEFTAAYGGDTDPHIRGGTMLDVEKTIQAMANAQTAASGDFTNPLFHQEIAEEQLKQENYDAIAIDFDVSAAKPLPNPYLIVVVQFHEKKAKPGTARNWIYAQSLDPIDATPRKIRLLRGGFPPGYEFEKVDVHLYNRGQEVATNVSPKRVPLTRDEAFQYLVVEHISAHKGATTPATPAMARLPTDLATRLAAGQGQKVYYVNVSKDGYVTDAYEDADYAKAIEDPFFSGVVKQIWFKPALENGKPVAAKTSVDLTKLRL